MIRFWCVAWIEPPGSDSAIKPSTKKKKKKRKQTTLFECFRKPGPEVIAASDDTTEKEQPDANATPGK